MPGLSLVLPEGTRYGPMSSYYHHGNLHLQAGQTGDLTLTWKSPLLSEEGSLQPVDLTRAMTETPPVFAQLGVAPEVSRPQTIAGQPGVVTDLTVQGVPARIAAWHCPDDPRLHVLYATGDLLDDWDPIVTSIECHHVPEAERGAPIPTDTAVFEAPPGFEALAPEDPASTDWRGGGCDPDVAPGGEAGGCPPLEVVQLKQVSASRLDLEEVMSTMVGQTVARPPFSKKKVSDGRTVYQGLSLEDETPVTWMVLKCHSGARFYEVFHFIDAADKEAGHKRLAAIRCPPVP